MLQALLSVALVAAPRLAAPGLTCSEIPAGTCRSLSEHLVQQLTRQGVSVVSAEDIATALGVERQRQLLGCSDENSSCTAEMAGALGVDNIVRGSIGAVGDTIIVNVRVISASSAKPVATFSETAKGLDAVPNALERAARQIADGLGVAAPAQQSGPSRRLALVPAAVGVAAIIGASIALGIASGASSELRSKMGAGADYDPGSAAQRGRSSALAAYVLFGVAGAAAATAGVMALLFSAEPQGTTGVTLATDGRGASLVWSGVFP